MGSRHRSPPRTDRPAPCRPLTPRLFTGLPRKQFLDWGRLLPFMYSGLLVVNELYMRYRATESPDIIKARASGEGKPNGLPMLRVLKEHPSSEKTNRGRRCRQPCTGPEWEITPADEKFHESAGLAPQEIALRPTAHRTLQFSTASPMGLIRQFPGPIGNGPAHRVVAQNYAAGSG